MDELLVLPSLVARPGADGGIILTKKYLSGMSQYARSWPGPTTSLVDVDQRPSTEMDEVTIRPDQNDTGVEVRPRDTDALTRRLKSAALVLAGLDGEELDLARLCQKLSVPLVFNCEYTLKTRYQIIDANSKSRILRARRKFATRRNHLRRMRALKIATGLQCSGVPAYEAYAPHKPNTLLFFDNRVNQADVIATADLEEKLAATQNGRPLRLAFGGRLVPMKGATDLPYVAKRLIEMGLQFTFEVVGSGPDAVSIEKSIKELGLEDVVRVKPPMDFASRWIPYLKSQVDLFVCCHKQGDPSSTYPEVMSCGVPIVGYNNEALVGIVEKSGGGSVSSPNPDDLALEIVRSCDYVTLSEYARNARAFATLHTFEQTFLRRVAHMVDASRLESTVKKQWADQFISLQPSV